MTQDHELLSAAEAAEVIGVSPATLWAWRTGRGPVAGPPFLRVGRGIRYRRTAVTTWLADCEVQPAAASA